jgi:hypothetical protein
LAVPFGDKNKNRQVDQKENFTCHHGKKLNQEKKQDRPGKDFMVLPPLLDFPFD